MDIEYAVYFNDGYDYSHYDMNNKIDFLCFNNKESLIEYINCMCIVMRGQEFTLVDKFPYKIVSYQKKLIGTTLKPSHGVLVSENDRRLGYFEGRKIKAWKSYLTDVQNMPVGITV